jgi:hypothetical protein
LSSKNLTSFCWKIHISDFFIKIKVNIKIFNKNFIHSFNCCFWNSTIHRRFYRSAWILPASIIGASTESCAGHLEVVRLSNLCCLINLGNQRWIFKFQYFTNFGKFIFALWQLVRNHLVSIRYMLVNLSFIS